MGMTGGNPGVSMLLQALLLTDGVTIEISPEAAQTILDTVGVFAENVSAEELTACTTVRQLEELLGLDGMSAQIGQMGIPGMAQPGGMSFSQGQTGEASAEFVMTDKVNSFSDVTDVQ